ncbi:MAG: cation diffusion facilitator family transporter [Haloarculaceae archaeon]
MAESKSVVLAALFANGAIAILKFVGFLLTASPAMLSETFHSISDTGNQVFLLIGIRYSGREPDARHPFGYGKAEFFYSFLVSVLLFGIAGWESATHGYEKIRAALAGTGGHHVPQQPELLGVQFPAVYVNYAVLVGAIVFEAYAFKKARASMKRQIEAKGWSGYREAFRKTSHVTTLTAFTEDFIAMAGAGIALFGVWLTQVTENPIFDAMAATLIGFLLMGFALALAWENKRLLLGESVPESARGDLRDLVAESEGVDAVVDFRTTFYGPGEVIVVADVDFQDDLTVVEVGERIDAIEAALQTADPEVIAAYVEVEEDGASSVQ